MCICAVPDCCPCRCKKEVAYLLAGVLSFVPDFDLATRSSILGAVVLMSLRFPHLRHHGSVRSLNGLVFLALVNRVLVPQDYEKGRSTLRPLSTF